MALQGIDTAVWTSVIPGGRGSWTAYRTEPRNVAVRDAIATAVATTPAIVAGLRWPPVAGRMFGGRDTADECRVAVVNEQAASTTFGGDALGRTIVDPSGERVEIVGVVRSRATGATAAGPLIYYYAGAGSAAGAVREPMHVRVPATPLTARAFSRRRWSPPGISRPWASRSWRGRVRRQAGTRGLFRVAVVNQQAADLFFEEGAVGATVIDVAGGRTEILGVVRSPLLRSSQRESPPAIFLPPWQALEGRMTLILGARRADAELVDAVGRALRRCRSGRIVAVRTLDAHLSLTALAPARIATLLVAAAAIFALVLAGLGLYGALAESARQRRREIALRLALGAQSWRVIRQVLSEGLRLAAVGAVGGAIGSVLVMRWLWRLAPGAGAPSMTEWLVLPAVLVGAVIIASAVPARRALAVSPLSIMRDS